MPQSIRQGLTKAQPALRQPERTLQHSRPSFAQVIGFIGKMTWFPFSLTGVLFSLFALALSGSALAQDSGSGSVKGASSLDPSFRSIVDAELEADLLSVRWALPDGRRFVLDRKEDVGLLKFDDDDEVVVLRMTSGQRGDDFFHNDLGRETIRLTYLGNVIYYSDDLPNGAPADFVEVAGPIAPPVIDASFKNGFEADARKRLGAGLAVILPEVSGRQQLWMQDAARNALSGIVKTGDAAKAVKGLLMLEADRVRTMLDEEGLLTVTFNPALGFGGRFSSDRIAKNIQRDLAAR